MNRHCILNRKLQSIIITFVFGLLTGVHMYCFMAGEAMVKDEWLYCFQSKRSGFMEGLITKMPQFHLLLLSDGKKTYVVGPERGQQIWISKGGLLNFEIYRKLVGQKGVVVSWRREVMVVDTMAIITTESCVGIWKVFVSTS